MWWWLANAAFAQAECPALDGVELAGTPGQRRIALVVGVGTYLARNRLGKPMNLKAPPREAERFANVLTTQYGFPPENVCLLTDGAATMARHDQLWTDHLGRAQDGDVVVYYFAGHGSRVKDQKGGDERNDGKDETLLLYNSRTGGAGELVDDDLNERLQVLAQATPNVTVIVDACRSGSATRSIDDGSSEAVDFTFARERRRRARFRRREGNEVRDYAPAQLPTVVRLQAATDETRALEKNGRLAFTTALLDGLERRGDGSWAQLTAEIDTKLRGVGQTPVFDGDLGRRVFGTTTFERGPFEVVGVNDHVHLRGVPTPGWTAGATVRVFADGSKAAKGVVELAEVSGFTAMGRRVEGTVETGDSARLETPGRAAATASVHLAMTKDQALRMALAQNPIRSQTLPLVDDADEADLVVRSTRKAIVVETGDGELRTRLDPDVDVQDIVDVLEDQADQRTLLAAAQSDAALSDLLDVRILASERGSPACPKTAFAGSEFGEDPVVVPLCTRLTAEVTLTGDPPAPLRLGTLVLGARGKVLFRPRDYATLMLTERDHSEVIELEVAIAPPRGTTQHLVVFGTTESIPWSSLQSRDPGADPSLETVADVAYAAKVVRLQAADEADAWTKKELADPRLCLARRAEFAGVCDLTAEGEASR